MPDIFLTYVSTYPTVSRVSETQKATQGQPETPAEPARANYPASTTPQVEGGTKEQ